MKLISKLILEEIIQQQAADMYQQATGQYPPQMQVPSQQLYYSQQSTPQQQNTNQDQSSIQNDELTMADINSLQQEYTRFGNNVKKNDTILGTIKNMIENFKQNGINIRNEINEIDIFKFKELTKKIKGINKVSKIEEALRNNDFSNITKKDLIFLKNINFELVSRYNFFNYFFNRLKMIRINQNQPRR